jgi:flagellin-like protein
MYLNFNSASATILLSLDSLNRQLNQTETELSTGNAINSAADNPALWVESMSEQSDGRTWGNIANEIGGVNAPELTTASNAISSVQLDAHHHADGRPERTARQDNCGGGRLDIGTVRPDAANDCHRRHSIQRCELARRIDVRQH